MNDDMERAAAGLRIRVDELRQQYERQHDDLQGLRLWNVDIETTAAGHRRTLSRVEEAAQNLHAHLIEFKATVAKQFLEVEARIAKLEGGGDGAD